jgi:hypothetical protein
LNLNLKKWPNCIDRFYQYRDYLSKHAWYLHDCQ